MMKMTVSRAICRVLARVGTACLLAAGTGAMVAAGTADAAAKVTPACQAPVISGATATVTCSYTGAAQAWTVPAGVLQATFTLFGAAGGTNPEGSGPGGAGAEVTGTLNVTPGGVLQVNVGQAGPNFGRAFGGGGHSRGAGGGGGGASDIRDAPYKLGDRLLVAGGGGGGGADGGGVAGGIAVGGTGGNAGSSGGTGASAIGVCDETLLGGVGGAAGTATTGGAGGAGNTSGSSCGGPDTPPNGVAGSKGTGGAGGEYGGAGGGGGYFGGGGGAGYAWDSEGPEAGAGGGGGGASYTGTAIDASVNDDPASPPSANGEVIITYRPVLAVTNHSLSGRETAVSCLTGSRCVAVGSEGSRGVVVTLAGGVQKHAAVLRGSSVIGSVSCPSASGCWATGHPVRGAKAYLVKISSVGRLAASHMVRVPAGTSLAAISCASMTSCEVAGADNRIRPAAIEVGTWNGIRLHLYRVRVPGSTRVSIGGISCWQGDCEAVGSARVGSANSDLIVTTSGGRPGTLTTDIGYGLRSISCVSATTCYAAGTAVLVTVTNGKPADPQAVPDSWNGNAIECTSSDCQAGGGEVFGSAHADVLVSLSDGSAGSPVIVQVGRGFTGIAARGSHGFIAIGARSNSGSEDTIG